MKIRTFYDVWLIIALNNVRKHSKSTQAIVQIEYGSEKVKLSVSDNGVGFEVPRVIGEFAHVDKLGLIGMQERVKLLDGTLKVESEIDKGTTITAEIPT